MTEAIRPHSPASRSTTTPVPDEERGVIRDASWNLYDRLSDAIGERSLFRVAFDGRDIEIMALGPKHEDVKDILGLFVNELYFGLEIDCRGLGSTTWKRSELGRGIEADLCFYFDPGKLQISEAAAARDSNDVADYPNPDLAMSGSIMEPMSILRIQPECRRKYQYSSPHSDDESLRVCRRGCATRPRIVTKAGTPAASSPAARKNRV